MPPATEQIVCPRYPDHGMARKKWLPPEERESIIKGDVFEIDCSICGKYEYQPPEN